MRSDIKIDPITNAPVMVNGDVDLDTDAVVTDARLIMQYNPGDVKEDATIGLGLARRINGDQTPADVIKLDKDIRQQLEYDAIIVKKIDTTTTPYTVNVDG